MVKRERIFTYDNVEKVIFYIYLTLCVLSILFKGSSLNKNNYDEFRTITSVVGLILIMFWLPKLKFKKKYVTFIIIGVICIVSYFTFDYKIDKYTLMVKYTQRVIMVCCLYLFNNKKRNYYPFIYMYIIGLLIIDLLSLYSGWSLIDDFSFRGSRFEGMYSNPNQLGQANAFLILLTCFSFKKGKIKYFVVPIIIFIGMLMVYLSGCRAAIVMLSVSLFVHLFKHKKKSVLILLCIIITIIVFLLLLNRKLLFSSSFVIEGLTPFESFLRYKSSNRYLAFKRGIRLLKYYPLFGVGVSNMLNASTQLELVNPNIYSTIYNSMHNVILDSYIEMGFVAGTAYMLFIYDKLKKIYKYICNTEISLFLHLSIASLVISMLDQTSINSYMQNVSFFFWISIQNIDIFEETIEENGKVIYTSVSDFFNNLNKSHEKYVVLRNYEDIHCDFVGKNRDLDILCQDRYRLLNSINSNSRTKENDDFVHRKIQIGNNYVDVDIRCFGDGYLDKSWQKDILDNRKMYDNFYVIDKNNYFYSLLYHVLIQKNNVSQNYKEKLTTLASEINVELIENNYYDILCNYMKEHGYKFTYPELPYTIFNVEKIDVSLIEFNIIKRTERFIFKLKNKIKGN